MMKANNLSTRQLKICTNILSKIHAHNPHKYKQIKELILSFSR